jgi:hypothetical protein
MATIKARGANPPYKNARLSAPACTKASSVAAQEEKSGLEPGDFEILVGNSSRSNDLQKLTLTVTK